MSDATPPRTAPDFDPKMLEALICPQTRTSLSYDAQRQELVSRAARRAYPIRNGIPILIIDESRALD